MDDAGVQGIAPFEEPYVLGQFPMKAEMLTITIDLRCEQFWFVIRAWAILWNHPEWPTWSALVEEGEAVSWTQLLEICGLIEDSSGHLRRFRQRISPQTDRDGQK